MVYKVTCSVCGKQFTALTANAKRCRACRVYNKVEREKRTVTCLVCHKKFETSVYNKQFCSPECRRKFHYNPEHTTKVCDRCGKVFSTTRKHQRFCSDQCRYDFYWKRDTPINIGPAPTIPSIQRGPDAPEPFELVGDYDGVVEGVAE